MKVCNISCFQGHVKGFIYQDRGSIFIGQDGNISLLYCQV